MSALVEDSPDRRGDLQTTEVSKADVLTKETSVAVEEESRKTPPNEAEDDGSKIEDDTVYVNGHPVIENGMIATARKENTFRCSL